MTDPAAEIPSELVAGKYQLTRMIGRGGMGSVWEGVHASLGTKVAVKFIESEYVDSVEARSRFDNEARAAAKLHSKHVVQVYDHGVMPDGRPYIVMEFLSGEPLDQRLDRLGRLAPQDTAQIINQVCRALTKAHQVGIVHRDLKPENVFLVWDDDDQADIAKVVDFGIAKFTDASMGVSSATRTGSVLGTPYFMSPEQARGLRSVDYRSDLWAVGVITFRAVVGRLPFEGEAVGDLLVKICTSPLPVPSQQAPDLPPGFDAWFAKALTRDPAERFSSAAEMAQELMNAVGLHTRGEMPSSMLAQGPGSPGMGYAPAMASPSAQGTGPQPAYHTPGTGNYPGAYQTPATGSHEAYQTPGTGPYPAVQIPGQQPVGYDGSVPTAASPGALTGAPFTHTADQPRRGAPVGAIVGLGLAGLLVVGIGVAALLKLAGGGGDEAAAVAGPDATESAPAEVAETLDVEPAGPPEVPAPPDAGAEEDEADEKKPKPASRPNKSVAARAKPVAAAPKPKPAPAPPKPKRPPPEPKPKPRSVDIGY